MRLSSLCNCLSMVFLIVPNSYSAISVFLLEIKAQPLHSFGGANGYPDNSQLPLSLSMITWLDSDQWDVSRSDKFNFLVTFFKGSCLSSSSVFCPFCELQAMLWAALTGRTGTQPRMKNQDKRNPGPWTEPPTYPGVPTYLRTVRWQRKKFLFCLSHCIFLWICYCSLSSYYLWTGLVLITAHLYLSDLLIKRIKNTGASHITFGFIQSDTLLSIHCSSYY